MTIRREFYLALASGACLIGACVPAPDTGSLVMQEPSTTDAVICLAGDVGTGGPGQYRVGLALQKLGCTQIRLLGDLVYPTGIRDASDEKLQTFFWKPYRALLRRQVPFYFVLGNHDYDGNAGAWLNVAQLDASLHMPARFYAEQMQDGLCIITLDTNWYEKLDLWAWRRTQTRWLHDALTRLKGSCTLSVGLGHHPLFGSGDHGDANFQTALFLKSEIAGKVDVYISGHNHLLSDEGDYSGTRWLISGAGAKNGGLAQRPGQASYLSERLGVLVLRPIQEDGKVRRAIYEFWEVPQAGDGPEVLAHRGVIDGTGIR